MNFQRPFGDDEFFACLLRQDRAIPKKKSIDLSITSHMSVQVKVQLAETNLGNLAILSSK